MHKFPKSVLGKISLPPLAFAIPARQTKTLVVLLDVVNSDTKFAITGGVWRFIAMV